MASVAIQPNLVPPAALVTFVQKGLQYMEAEANLDPVRTLTRNKLVAVSSDSVAVYT
jgi:transducin (beta)-like 1